MLLKHESFRPPRSHQKKCQRFGKGIRFTKSWESHPKNHPRIFPYNQLTAETCLKNAKKGIHRPTTPTPAIRTFQLIDPKTVNENPGGDEKMHGKPGWQVVKMCQKIHSGVQLSGCRTSRDLRSLKSCFFRFGSTLKKWPKRTLAKLRWERGYAVEGRLAGSNLGKHHLCCEKKDSTRNQSCWLRVCCSKNWGGFIWGDLEVCVQRWSLVWRQELAVCVRALGNMKAARCMPAPSSSWGSGCWGHREIDASTRKWRKVQIYIFCCVWEKSGRGMVVSKKLLWFDLEHFFGICRIQV